MLGEFCLPSDEDEGGRREMACQKSSEDQRSLTKSKKRDPFWNFSFFDLTKALMIDTAVQWN
jgi:hypothetical protein